MKKPQRLSKARLKQLDADHNAHLANQVMFCAHWWVHARGHAKGPPHAAAYNLHPNMADALRRQCEAEWKGGKR